MENIKEDKTCYDSQAQRDVLFQLITHSTIEEKFFLTGGTALSVFYLHHRLSYRTFKNMMEDLLNG